MAEFESLDGDDAWDFELAGDLVGCTLLVGLTYIDHEDRLLRRRQRLGTVLAADPDAGITVRQADGEVFTIAPILDAIEAAGPGVYQLADENEIVEDPDFTAMLTVRSPHRS